MTNKFSLKSQNNLDTCHPLLKQLMEAVLQEIDITILCGHRNEADQEAAFAGGHSKLHWPHGNHNKFPSLAVDVSPYPVEWSKPGRFLDLSLIVKKHWDIMANKEYKLIYGGDWSNFKDLPHYELVAI